MRITILAITFLLIPSLIFSQTVELAWSETVEFKSGVLRNIKYVDILSVNADKTTVTVSSYDQKESPVKYVFNIQDLKERTVIVKEFNAEMNPPDLTKNADYNKEEGTVQLYSNGGVIHYDSISYIVDKKYTEEVLEQFTKTTNKKGDTIYKAKKMTNAEKLELADNMKKMASNIDNEEPEKGESNNVSSQGFGIPKEFHNKTVIVPAKDGEEASLISHISSFNHYPVDASDSGYSRTRAVKYFVSTDIEVSYNGNLIASFPKYYSNLALPTSSIHLNQENKEIYVLHNHKEKDPNRKLKYINHTLLSVVRNNGDFKHFSMNDPEAVLNNDFSSCTIFPISTNEIIILKQGSGFFNVAYVKIGS